MILEHKGIRVFYTNEGKGNTIVLLHGFLENSTMWDDLKPKLLEHSRVICIDLLGHGQTECLGYIHTMEAMAEAVMTVLVQLKIEKFTVIGHSMGGYVALALTEKHSDMIKGLCLMNSSAKEDDNERKANRDRAIMAVKRNYKTFVSMSISNLFAEGNKTIFKKEIEHVKREALKTPLQGIVAALEGMKLRPNREHVLQNNSFKKIMIIGRKDPVLEYELLIEQTKGTTVEVVEFPDGHMSHIENMKELTYIIMRFN